MFRIKNITDTKVSLGDLGIIVEPGGVIDLARFFSREKIDKSETLRKSNGMFIEFLDKRADVNDLEKRIEEMQKQSNRTQMFRRYRIKLIY